MVYLTGRREDREQDKKTRDFTNNIRNKRTLEIASEEHGFTPPWRQKQDFVEYCRELGKTKRPRTRASGTCRSITFTHAPGVPFSKITDFLQKLSLVPSQPREVRTGWAWNSPKPVWSWLPNCPCPRSASIRRCWKC